MRICSFAIASASPTPRLGFDRAASLSRAHLQIRRRFPESIVSAHHAAGLWTVRTAASTISAGTRSPVGWVRQSLFLCADGPLNAAPALLPILAAAGLRSDPLSLSRLIQLCLLHSMASDGRLVHRHVSRGAHGDDGLLAIHKAILSKTHAIINYLLTNSASPFICDKDGATLMLYAVQTACNQTIKTLLLYNVDINRPDDI